MTLVTNDNNWVMVITMVTLIPSAMVMAVVKATAIATVMVIKTALQSQCFRVQTTTIIIALTSPP